jgi:hypothetical protein
VGKELLRELEFVRAHAVVRHQKPAAHALLHAMHMVARSGLRDLVEEPLRVAAHELRELGELLQRTPKGVGPHPERLACDLGKGPCGRALHAQEQGGAEQTFFADGADLDRSPVAQRQHQGDDATQREIRVRHRSVGLVQDLAHWQRDLLGPGEQPQMEVAGQSGQKAILSGSYETSGLIHLALPDSFVRRKLKTFHPMLQNGRGTADGCKRLRTRRSGT